jgi:hypothetical protein
MQLSVKKRGQAANELRFKTGPVYIGRQVGSQVFLPDRSVSRQHAVIYQDAAGNWLIEDLASTNKTFVNNTAIHKTTLNEDDIVKTGDFIIRVSLKETEQTSGLQSKKQIHLDDTIADGLDDLQQIVRQPQAKNAPPLSFPTSRIKDLGKASNWIVRARSIKELHRAVIDLMHNQFSAYHAWFAIRKEPSGSMTIESGRSITSEFVKRYDLAMHMKINYVLEKQKYILVPQMPSKLNPGKIRSVMIAPILQGKKCYGVIYTNCTAEHQRYDPADLDYLMLMSTLIANQVERV